MLGFGKTYTLAGTATGTDGKQIPIAGTYTTVSADTQTRNTVNPADGAVVGVAAPISVSFGVEPEDRALIEKHVTITTVPAVEGAWALGQARRRPLGAGLPDQGLLAGRHPGARRRQALRPEAQRHARTARPTSPATSPSAATRWSSPTSTRTTWSSSRTATPSPATRPPTAAASDIGDPNLVTRSGIHVVTEQGRPST